jgi:YfiH family protein
VTDALASFPVLQIPQWQTIPHLVHGFCTRRGGVSVRDCAELNLSFNVGDSPSAVEENWARVRARVDNLELVTMNQVHGETVAEIGTDGVPPGDADAMITAARGVGLCVLTADCVPILLVSPATGAVAAVHAGWKGTLRGVVVAALGSMTERMGARPDEILAAIGPAIGSCCYEVDRWIADDIESRWGGIAHATERYESDGTPKAKIDLAAVNAKLLNDLGVARERISKVGRCTACNVADFYSHRVASRSNATTGRQLSFIGWSH